MKKIAVAGLLTAMMATASAQVYVGGGIGQTHLNVDCASSVTCDATDTGGKLYVGYKFTPNLALEGTYFNFGEATARGPGGRAALKTTAIGLGLAGRAALSERVSFVGRLGLAQVKADGSVNTVSLVGSDSETSAQAYFGLAVEFALMKSLKAFASADFSQIEVDGDSGAVRLLGVGLQYDF
ncbi:MAG: hypothetical protein A2711_10145 [Burkholderiales bacterium RIFCSPHIGHO2_01_FULL_63_240]|jgi:OOP family OmpA-OmpF porin|nr:MAG: hypothetical protein A2711_10145 [Burkholderiales bacterium RIFCSPHIGHO2_01_FULL_63_240]